MDTGRWEWGELRLKQDRWEGSGVGFLRFRAWLESQLAGADHSFVPGKAVQILAYEQVAGDGRGAFRQTIDGQRGILLAAAEAARVPYGAINAMTLKRWMCPDTWPVNKAAMRDAVMRRWHEFAKGTRKPVKLTENEADALAVGFWAFRELVGNDGA
jgi:hypothetical protein